MLRWLATLWRAVVAALAYRQGHAAGQADQRQADVAAANTTAQEIVHAEESAPADRAAVSRKLRSADPI